MKVEIYVILLVITSVVTFFLLSHKISQLQNQLNNHNDAIVALCNKINLMEDDMLTYAINEVGANSGVFKNLQLGMTLIECSRLMKGG